MITAQPIVETLLADLATRGIRLHVQDDRLRCEAPRGALTDELKAQLAAHKPELLARLRARSPRCERITGSEPARLSHAQQRLWVVAQVDETSAAYNMRIALRVTGLLEVSTLEGALQAVVRRHDVLRTAFVLNDESPLQVVHDAVNATLTRQDLRGLPADDQRARLDQIMAEAALRPFELQRPPLLRAAVVQLSELEHVLLVILHHLVCDGASLGILVAEIGELYTAAVRCRAPRLPELTIQYADFAAWQREQLGPRRLSELRAYWLEQLRGAPPYLEVPTDRPRTLAPAPQGAVETFVVPAALAGELRAFARAHGVTLYTTLLAAFAVLLSRYSGQDDIVIGAPVSLRTLPELQPLIGMFVNTVVFRVRLDGNPSFAELVERVRTITTEAYIHQDLPLEHLVASLQPERSPAYHPVFQVMFNHDDAPAVGDLAGLSFEPLEYRTFDAKFDLMLSMAERADGIHGCWEYRCDLFDATTLQRATGHLLTLLQALVLAPRQRALQAPMLTGDERRRMLHDWNNTARVYPDARGLHQLFEDQVARTPAAVAVRFGDATVSYAALSERSNQIAAYLLDLGIGRGNRVAVALPRSPDMLASLLGVLKTGAAYVPLDTRYPSARLAFMLADAAPAALLTASPDIACPPGTLVVRIDAVVNEPRRLVREVEVRPRDPAYLMYTSGTSGQPKAAIINHAGLTNYLRWFVETYDVARGAGVVVSSSVAFDTTVASLYSPLLVGRAVMLLPEDDEVAALAALLGAGEPLGLLNLATAYVDALRATAVVPRPGGVHAIVISGEQLLGEHVAWCRAAAPEARIFNEYGPTETTVGCSTYEVHPGSVPLIIPIGRPIANTQLYVLDAHLAPSPIGVTGELYIGGAGVADGYHARPELTAERFVDDPFSPTPGARMYRTGDLVTHLADGNLRFLGRRDGQVKVRGFRIELSEIEAVLARHPAVGQAVAVVQRGASGHPRLVAFVVAAGAPPTAEQLRQHVASQLPDHMVPSVTTVVPELPLTPNGKVDRAALTACELPEPTPAPVASAEHVELVALWCEILGLPAVGITDNFFALGGDSILGIQLVSRARARGIHFTPRQLVENQTIETLARAVRREARVRVEQGPVTGEVPLTSIQRWFFAQAYPEPHHFNQSLMLEVPADCDITALRSALRALVEHHDSLRARFAPQAGRVVQTFVSPQEGESTFERIDLSAVPPDERLAALTERASALQTALRLDAGRLFAPTLFWFGPDAPGRLLLTTHHLVVDGVSWRILLEDLLRAYKQASAGELICLPAKTSSPQVWTERLEAWATSAALSAQRLYWSSIEDQPSKPLPLDQRYSNDANRAAFAAVVTRALTAEQTAPLCADVASAYNAGIEDLLVTALARTFTEAGDHSTLIVDMESHGRAELFDDVDLSRTVGWFTSVFPVQLELRGGCEPTHTLMVVKEQLRGVPNLGLGYGVLRYRGDGLGLERVPRAISFNYFGQLDRAQPAHTGFSLATTSCGPSKDPESVRSHLLEVNASILAGVLSIEWTYSERLFLRATVEALATRFVTELEELVRCCHGRNERRYTPSDFPDVALSQVDLDGIVAEISLAQSAPLEE